MASTSGPSFDYELPDGGDPERATHLLDSRSGPSRDGHNLEGAGNRPHDNLYPYDDDDTDDTDDDDDSGSDSDLDEMHHLNLDSTETHDRELDGKKLPGGFDTTPFPEAPQGYTIRFIFHSARDLPVADFHTGSADPYIIATLNAARHKRHREDPDLKYRTVTRQSTLKPVWDDEWVVSNVPPSGFSLKCRMYDEDNNDKDDRLGNVTVHVPRVSDDWLGFPPPGEEFSAKKRVMSKRAYLLKGISNALYGGHITPKLRLSIQVLGRSKPPFAQMCTLGPTMWIKHYSPMIGRLVGTKVNADELDDEKGGGGDERRSQKYDFQANQIQLQGPVPEKLYHRYVEFRPIIGPMFASTGVRGTILNKALHRQHSRIYSFNASTERGRFEACSEEASLQFLRMAHFDDGGRIFTYVLSLDGLLRFTETGKEFGVDLLSKHTMHSDAEMYIACSGEFFIRRRPTTKSDQSDQSDHDKESESGPHAQPKPSSYQLFIDNESGTYRPDKSILPLLKEFLQANLPGLEVVALSGGDERLQELKEEQRSIKKASGKMMHVVMNKSSSSSLSSVESALDRRDETWEQGRQSKREAAYGAMMKPDLQHIKEVVESALPGFAKK